MSENKTLVATAARCPVSTPSPRSLLRAVEDELRRALDLFPSFNSPHEGKAVIEEELDELWQHVKENTGRSVEARTEAIQLAAMALRYALDLCPTIPEHRAGGSDE